MSTSVRAFRRVHVMRHEVQNESKVVYSTISIPNVVSAIVRGSVSTILRVFRQVNVMRHEVQNGSRVV